MVDWRETFSAGAAALGVPLDAGALDRFSSYLDALLEWNPRVNLTRITDPEQIAVKHFVDSLTCLRAAEFGPSARLADVGSGAGLPGVALAIARPDLRVTLIESSRRRCDFLRHVIRALGLDRVEVACLRAEDAGRQDYYRQSYDLAVSRAVARLAVLAEYCLPLVRVGGAFLAQKGREAETEVAKAAPALEALGGTVEASTRFELPGGAGERKIVVIRKVAPTPEAYPRRAGVPAKRPLGG
jgi:16S rRNA (guanine527-N7)-methyltransferase